MLNEPTSYPPGSQDGVNELGVWVALELGASKTDWYLEDDAEDRFLRRKKNVTTKASVIRTTPPTTPPAIAPACI